MNGLVEKSGKKYFMEQFLYMDSTEAFSYNTQIEESQVADYVKNAAPILKILPAATDSGYTGIM